MLYILCFAAGSVFVLVLTDALGKRDREKFWERLEKTLDKE